MGKKYSILPTVQDANQNYEISFSPIRWINIKQF